MSDSLDYSLEIEEFRKREQNRKVAKVTRNEDEEKHGLSMIQELLQHKTASNEREVYLSSFNLISGPDCKRITTDSAITAWKLLLPVCSFQ